MLGCVSQGLVLPLDEAACHLWEIPSIGISHRPRRVFFWSSFSLKKSLQFFADFLWRKSFAELLKSEVAVAGLEVAFGEVRTPASLPSPIASEASHISPLGRLLARGTVGGRRVSEKNLERKLVGEKKRKYAVLPLCLPAVAGRRLDGPLWVGEARLRGSGNRANLLSGRVGGQKKKN